MSNKQSSNLAQPSIDESLITTVPGSKEQYWALCAHLSPLLSVVVAHGMPRLAWPFITPIMELVFLFLGPLLIWQLKKDSGMLFLVDQAKEAFNFNITMLVAKLILLLAWMFLGIFYYKLPLISTIIPPKNLDMNIHALDGGTIAGGILLILSFIIWLYWIVSIIKSVISVKEGRAYRYSYNLRIFK